jgi:DNA-binding response OmpR family regulator
VLVVEDDTEITDVLRRSLRHEGYQVRTAGDGVTALDAAAEFIPDLVVLDLGLPRLDGIEVCRQLRADGDVPILILTARTETDDRVTGLDSGADDYLIKPFEIRELEARVKALIRRDRRQVSAELLSVGDLILDTASLRLTRGGQELMVSPIGLRLLMILMRESPRVVSRRDIEREVWGDLLPDSDTLRSHLYNLRKIIDKPFQKPLLHTIHSAGYRLADLDAEIAASRAS